MSFHDEMQSYIQTICAQIRWKRVHGQIETELTNHILDQQDAYLQTGVSEQEAMTLSLRDTGDAVQIGMELDRTHRPKPPVGMFCLVAALLALGIAMQLLFGFPAGGSLARHIASIAVGGCCMLLFYFLDFSILGRQPAAVCLTVGVLFAASYVITPRINGIRFYASFVVTLFPLVFAVYLYTRHHRGYRGFAQCLVLLMVLLFMTASVPALPQTLLLSIIGIVLLYDGARKDWFGANPRACKRILAAAVAFLLGVAISGLSLNPHLRNRLMIVLHPESDPSGLGYLILHIRQLLADAQLLGTPSEALAQMQTFFYADFQLTALIVSAGWVPFSIVVTTVFCFLAVGIRKALRQTSSLGKYVSLSIMLYFTGQFTFYLLSNLGICNFSGVLPLLSYGTISMITHLTLIGFLLSVFRAGHVVQDDAHPVPSAQHM